jgi:uncharacterized protein (DUF2147 family)
MMRCTLATMKRAIGGCAMVFAVSLALAVQAAAPQDAIVGTWLTEDGGSKVDVAASKAADGSTSYSGRVSWLKVPTRDGKPLVDANNDDASLRDRPILGLEILSGFKATGAGAWTGGTLYAPRNGKSFPADLTLLADGRLEVKVKAGIITRTVYWTR